PTGPCMARVDRVTTGPLGEPRSYAAPRLRDARARPATPTLRAAREGPATPERRPPRSSMGALARPVAVAIAVALSGLAASGCRVNEDDVHRWESTEHGPDKLSAVLFHDKYDTNLRVEAALSLVRMKPRAGRRIGIGIMVETLAKLPPETRQVIVASLVPAIVLELKKPP